MKTVELQHENIPHDMICYRDSERHIYDFGYGMNWKGVIHDARMAKYADVIKKPEISIKNNTVACPTPGVKIYYTTDNSTPRLLKAMSLQNRLK